MYPNEYCHQCEPELPPIEVPPPPVCEGEECEEIYTGNCVKYTGPAIPCLSITTNESLNSVIAKLAARVCSCCNGGTPVNCVVSEWGPWSECINGVQVRTRTVLVSPQNGGTACPPLTETRECSPSCTPIINLAAVSEDCETVTTSFIDDGSADYFQVTLLTADGAAIDTVVIQGSGTLDSYQHIFTSVPAGTVFVKVEKFCAGVNDPLSQSSGNVNVAQCIPPCENPQFGVNVLDCETIEVTLDETATLPFYDVEYKAQNALTWTSAQSMYNATMDNTITISNLAEATQYTVRVRHYCSETNVSLWSEVVVVTPSCEVVSCTTPSYTANAPVCDRINVTLDGASAQTPTYDVEYRALPSGAWISAAALVDASVNNIVSITGLLASQAYEVRVRRVCEEDLYSNWIVLGVTTPACITPCTDPDFRLAQSGCDGIEVTAITGVGVSNLFEVQYKLTSGTTWSVSQIINGDVNDILTILGLTENTSYDIRVRRICGNGTYSAWVTDSISTAPCVVGDCFEVIVTSQPEVDMSLYQVEGTDANGDEIYVLLSGITFDEPNNTWTFNMCSYSVPVLVDGSLVPAAQQTITATPIGSCNDCVV